MALTFTQLENLWVEAFGPVENEAIAASVALAESSGVPTAVSPAGAIGLWQILPSAHPQYSPTRLKEPLYNAEAAVAISGQGYNWQPWDVAWTDCKRGTQGGTYAPMGDSCSGRIYQAHTGAVVPPKRATLAPKHDTPKTQLRPQHGPTGPVGVKRDAVTEAWHRLTYALGRTIPTQDHKTREILHQFPHAIRQGLIGPVGRR